MTWELNKLADNCKKINWKLTTPSRGILFNCFKLKPSEVRVVIVGQDPYYTKGTANGLAFAVGKGEKVPPSLNNIFKEIINYKGSLATDETLEHWVKQGVLLINMSLTVEIGKPNSHKKIWENDVTKLLLRLANFNNKIVWVLWGKESQKLKNKLPKKTICIEDAHPSPLSSYRRNKDTFKLLEKYLKINW